MKNKINKIKERYIESNETKNAKAVNLELLEEAIFDAILELQLELETKKLIKEKMEENY